MSGAITRRDLDVVGYAAYVVKLLLKKMMYVVVLSLGHRLSFVSIRLRVKKTCLSAHLCRSCSIQLRLRTG